MKKLLLILAMVLMATSTFALDFTVTGVTITATYQEPATNADGSPLLDLDHTSIYYNMGAGDVKAKDVTATTLTGNGNISTTFEVPIIEGMERDVDFWTTASDRSANESAKSVIVRKRIDRLAPAAPR